jgi:hypothetical protein
MEVSSQVGGQSSKSYVSEVVESVVIQGLFQNQAPIGW